MSFGLTRKCKYCGKKHLDTYKGSVDHYQFECGKSPEPVEPTDLDGGPTRPTLDNTGILLPSVKLGVVPRLGDAPRGLGLYGSRS